MSMRDDLLADIELDKQLVRDKRKASDAKYFTKEKMAELAKKQLHRYHTQGGKAKQKIYRDKNAKELAEKSRLHMRNNKERLIKLLDSRCLHCQQEFPIAAFDFHHVDPNTKEKHLRLDWKWKTLENYIKGCILLCSNCHRILHAKDGDGISREAVSAIDTGRRKV